MVEPEIGTTEESVKRILSREVDVLEEIEKFEEREQSWNEYGNTL